MSHAHTDIIAWLRSNGIDPAVVPVSEVPAVDAGLIRCRVCVRYRGKTMLNPHTGDLLTKITTVPLKTKPAGIVTDWLQGRVDHMGRPIGGQRR